MENEKNTSKQIIDVVSERIAGSSQTIFDAVVKARTNVEVDRRVDLVEKTLTKLQDAKKTFGKLSKPDINTGYSEDGTKLPDAFSKERIEEKKKLTESYDKVEAALNKAMETQTNDDWNKLSEAMNKL